MQKVIFVYVQWKKSYIATMVFQNEMLYLWLRGVF